MKKTILFLISLIILIGCNESTTPDNTGKNYKMVKGWIYFYQNGSYGEKRLWHIEEYIDGLKTKFEQYGNDIIVAKWTYEYDENKNLVKSTLDNTDPESIDTYTIYTYENGKLTAETEYDFDSELSRESVYEYDSKGKISKVNHKNYYFGPDNPEESCDIYTYDSNGNLIKKVKLLDCDEFRSTQIEEWKYDSSNRIIEYNMDDDYQSYKEMWSYNSGGLVSEKILYIDGEIMSKLVLEYIY